MSANPWYRHLARRLSPRIPVETLCTEISDRTESPALVIDLSNEGLLLVRPYRGRVTSPIVQVELELPGVDEIVWAKGVVRFDELRRCGGRLLRATGIRIAAAARRDLDLLRGFVHERCSLMLPELLAAHERAAARA